MSNKRIIIVEDEQDMAELVALQLQHDGYVVEVAHDGQEGLRQIRSSPPDLVLLDIMLPRLSGIEVLKEVRNDASISDMPVIMLTAKSEESDIIVGLHLGADDYVTKPFNMSVLTARIAAVLRRRESAGIESATLSAGPITINQHTHRVDLEGKPLALTLTEFRLLTALVSTKGRVLSRNQLIDRAMGMDAVVTDRTIDVHLTALRRKLGKARKYIQTVRGVGYRLAVADDETT